jgi:hypothetical protein
MGFDNSLLRLEEGDIITSKKGFVLKSSISNDTYRCHKIEVMGDGFFRAIDKIIIRGEAKK